LNWLAVIAAALTVLRLLIEYLRDKRAIDAAVAKALLESNREMRDAIDNANDARERVRSDLVRDPANILQDDSFKRPD
jgi:uncharacterized protein YfeS